MDVELEMGRPAGRPYGCEVKIWMHVGAPLRVVER